MAPSSSSKPPSSHQTRPPLASRIRASFELKRSKSTNKGHSRSDSHTEDLSSPISESNGSPIITNGFLSGSGGQDGDTLRSAVDQAISSDAFQSAIAAHLAKLIKPSIKSALDTIQPLVEAVYTHELLLRKTNQNVENALERMETNTNASQRASRINLDEGGDLAEQPQPEAAQATTRDVLARGSGPDLGHFKQSMEEHNIRNATVLAGLSASMESTHAKIGEVAEGVAEIKGSLGQSIETLKMTSEESNTTISALQAQLDQLKIDVAQILEAIGSDLGKNVQAIHERGVAEPDASFVSEHTTKLDAISTDVAALKGHGDTAEKIDAIALELAVLKGSVEGGIASNTEGLTGLEAQITSVLSAIEGQTALLGEIKEAPPHPDLFAAVQQSNESHALHTSNLGELKERSFALSAAPAAMEGGSRSDNTALLSDLKSDLASLKENIELGLNSHGENLSGLSAKLDSISSTIEEHKASGSSADILVAIQQSNQSHASHAAALEDIKLASGTHTAALESHGAALGEIRAISSEAATTDSSAYLEPHLTSMISTLEAHAAVLEELNGASGAHTAALETHGASLDGLKSLSAGSEPSNAVDLAPLEAQVAAIVSTLEAHSEALGEIKTNSTSHTTALESHGTALEGIKSIGSVDAPLSDASDLAGVEAQINAVIETLQTHTSFLEELKGTTSSHATAFAERSVESTQEGGTLSGLETKLGSLASTLESHGSILNEIKEDVSAEILTALHNIDQKQENCSNLLVEVREGDVSEEVLTLLHGMGETANGHAAGLQSLHEAVQTSHGALEEIKLRDFASAEVAAPAHVDLSSLEAQIAALHTVLGEHKDTLSSIKDAATASHDLHIAHGSSLEEIKSRSIEPAPASDIVLPSFGGIEAKLDNVVATLDEHKTNLSSIKDTTATSHDLHIAHGSSIDEIKSRSLESVPPPAVELPSFGGIETKLDHLIAALDEHKSTLSAIKDTTSASQESHDSHALVLEDLKSRSIESAPVTEVPSFEGMEGKIDALVSSLEEHKATLSVIMDTTSASHEIHASHAASLEEIKSRSAETVAAVESLNFGGIDAHLGGIVASLEEHKTMLSAMQQLHGDHAASLDDIKSRSADPAPVVEAPDFSGLEAQISGVVASLKEHKAMLSSIQDLHGAHTTSLDEIKAKSIDPDHISGILAGLEEHKASLATIQERTLASHDLHVVHASSLDEIKTRSIDSVPEVQPTADIEGLKAQISSIITSMEDQKSVLIELKDTTSGLADTHTTHATILNEIKDGTAQSNESHASHATALGDLKAIPEPASPDLSAIEAHLNTIITTLESQTEALSSLKEGTPSTEIYEAVKQSHELLTTNHELLTSHKSLLSDIKEGSSKDEVVASLTDIKSLLTESKSGIDSHGELVKDLHSTTKDSHSNLTTAIAALALGGAAGAGTTALLSDHNDSPAEVLAEVKAVRVIVERSKEDIESMRSQLDINHTTVTTSLSSLGDEIKAEIDASATTISEFVAAVHGDVKVIDLTPVHATLEQHRTEVKGLASQLEGIDEGVKAIDLTPFHASLEQHGNDVKSLATQLEVIDGGVKAIDLAPIHAALEQHSSAFEQHGSDVQTLSTHLESLDPAPLHAALELHGAGIDGIYAQLEGLDGSIKETSSHIQALHDGVYLNDTGVQQLKSHAVSRQAANAPISEGAWFKRDKSISPVLEKKNSTGEDGGHSFIPAVLAGTVAGGALIGGTAALLSGDDEDDAEEILPTTESSEEDKEIEPLDEAGATGTIPPDSEVDPSPAIERIDLLPAEQVEEDQLPEDQSFRETITGTDDPEDTQLVPGTESHDGQPSMDGSVKEIEESGDMIPEYTIDTSEQAAIDSMEDFLGSGPDIDELSEDIQEGGGALPEGAAELPETPILDSVEEVPEANSIPSEATEPDSGIEESSKDNGEIDHATEDVAGEKAEALEALQEPQLEAEPESQDSESIPDEPTDNGADVTEPIMETSRDLEAPADFDGSENLPVSEEVTGSKEADLEAELPPSDSEAKPDDALEDPTPSDLSEEIPEVESSLPVAEKLEILHSIDEQDVDEMPAQDASVEVEGAADAEQASDGSPLESDEKGENLEEGTPIVNDSISTHDILDEPIVPTEHSGPLSQEHTLEDTPVATDPDTSDNNPIVEDPEPNDSDHESKEVRQEDPSNSGIEKEESTLDLSKDAPALDVEDSTKADDLRSQSETPEPVASQDLMENEAIVENNFTVPTTSRESENEEGASVHDDLIISEDPGFHDHSSIQDVSALQEEPEVQSEDIHSDTEALQDPITESLDDSAAEPIAFDEDGLTQEEIEDDMKADGTNQEQLDSDEDKPEGALSPILESPIDDEQAFGVEDPFSDAQISDSLPSHP